MSQKKQFSKFIGLGFMSFGPWDPKIEDIKSPLEVIKYGISKLEKNQKLLIDTAQMYGFERGANEKLLYKVLSKLDKKELNKLVVISKGGICLIRPETENKDHSLFSADKKMYESSDNFLKSWTKTSKNLGIGEFIGVEWGFFLHRRHYDDKEFSKQLEILVELKKNRKVNYIGVSELSLGDLKKSSKYMSDKEVNLDFLESELSMNCQFIREYLPFCQKNGINILGYSPTSRGFWTDAFSPDNLPSDPWRGMLEMWKKDNFLKMYPMLEAVQKFAKKKECLISQIAIAWVNNLGCIPIPGSSSIKHNKDNVDGFGIILTEEEFNELDSLVYDMMEKWGIKRYF